MNRQRGFCASIGLALVMLLVAGCVDGGPTDVAGDEGVRSHPDDALLRFARPVVIDATRVATEPALEIISDLELWVCAPRGVGRGTDVWHSMDAGASFAYVGVAPTPGGPAVRSGGGDFGGGDCDIDADAGGRVYVVDTWLGNAVVSSTVDRGSTWQGTPISQAMAGVDRPWVLGGAADEVFVVASQPAPHERSIETPAPSGVWVARSTDGGRTFPQQTLVVSNPDRFYFNSNLATDGERLYLAYTRRPAEDRIELVMAVSQDRGSTWTHAPVTQQAIDAEGCFPWVIFPIVAADSSGSVAIAWAYQDPAVGRTDLYFVASPDGGQTWNAPILITDRPGTRAFPWMAARGLGSFGVAWYETNATLQMKPAEDGLSCGWTGSNDAQWFLSYAFSDNALAPGATFGETFADARPAHKGVLDRPYAERIDLEFDPEGRAAAVYVADGPAGVARPTFAKQESSSASRQVSG